LGLKSQGATRPEGAVTRLLVRVGRVQTKIEVTPVLRGCVYEPQIRRVTDAVEKAFGFAEARVVSFADLYAGKIVAALDRQHPRDLFDVRDLLAQEGLDERLRRAFLVYLVSHNRPMCEVLAPKRKTIGPEYRRGFSGMTARPVTLGALKATRESLIDAVVTRMPEAHRRFLLSFERGEADWAIFGLPSVADLPAVRWRQQNLAAIGAEKRDQLVAKLEKVWSKSGKENRSRLRNGSKPARKN